MARQNAGGCRRAGVRRAWRAGEWDDYADQIVWLLTMFWASYFLGHSTRNSSRTEDPVIDLTAFHNVHSTYHRAKLLYPSFQYTDIRHARTT